MNLIFKQGRVCLGFYVINECFFFWNIVLNKRSVVKDMTTQLQG